MKTIIDIRALVPEKSGGIIQNIVGVLRALFASAGADETYVIACTIFNRHLVEAIPGRYSIYTLPLHRYYDSLEGLRLQHGADVVFHVYPRGDCVDYDLSKRVFYIPDIQHDFLPEFFSPEIIKGRQEAFSPVLRHAGAIGAISEFTRKTLQDHPLCACKDIFLMPPALQEEHAAASIVLSPEEEGMVPQGNFLFFPANLWPHKNHRGLFEALRILSERHGITVPLVLTGSPETWPALQREYADLPIRHLGYVRGEMVSALFRRATTLCFFSLFEGFGIPLLEAFHAGTPVACSDTTSLPEVAGDAALYASPLDPEAMAQALRRLLSEPELRRELVERGHGRLEQFSWQRSAENLRAALTRVAALPARHALQPAAGSISQRTEIRPLVSIVTPSFNQARFIADTIESVLNQSYDRIEYVVMDGASTDGTVEILKHYSSRLRWVSEPDGGQSEAINKGMAMVSGDILAYLNSDDVLEPDAVANMVAYFAAHPEVDMVYGEALYIDAEGREIGRYKTKPYSHDALIHDCIICQPAAFWRRRVAEAVGPFDDRLHYAMDYDYWLRMRKIQATIAHVPDVWARSRLHSDAKTIGQRGKVFGEIFEICRRNLDYVAGQYFQGLWHYRLVERYRLLGPVIGSFPSIWLMAARLHRLHYFARTGLLRGVVGGYLRAKATRGSRLAALMLQAYQRFRKRQQSASGVERLVTGFWSDNWLSGEVGVAYAAAAGARRIFLNGSASRDCHLDVSFNGRQILRQALMSGQPAQISFDLPAVHAGDKLQLSFSSWDAEVTGRQLAFLLDGTNVFAEGDGF